VVGDDGVMEGTRRLCHGNDDAEIGEQLERRRGPIRLATVARRQGPEQATRVSHDGSVIGVEQTIACPDSAGVISRLVGQAASTLRMSCIVLSDGLTDLQ